MNSDSRSSGRDRGVEAHQDVHLVNPPSLLSAYADNVIEACLLAVLVLTPLFVNPYVNQFFEPSKASLVRVIASVMLVAWIVRGAERVTWPGSVRKPGSAGHPTRLLPHAVRAMRQWASSGPLALPTLILVLAYIIATVASISPALSTFGSYERSQGLLTTLSYIVIALVAAHTIRSPDQIKRAFNVILIVSFPVAFYGVMQRYGLDPLDWPGLASFGGDRVASTIGNPIFLGAYLLMIVPVTLVQLLGHAERTASSSGSWARKVLIAGSAIGSAVLLILIWIWGPDFGSSPAEPAMIAGLPGPEELSAAQGRFHFALGLVLGVIAGWWVIGWRWGRPRAFLLIGVYASLLALQVAAIVFTQSRGPFLGLLIGLFVFAVLYALVRHARRAALGILGIGTLVFILILGLNVFPWSGGDSRLWRLFDLEDSTSQVRVLMWEGTLDLARPHPPLWSPATGEDALNPLRPLIGYGPESLSAAYHFVYQPELGSLAGPGAIPDRAHNALLDALAATGALGAGAYLVLMTSIFLYGLQRIGLIQSRRQSCVFLALWSGTGAVSALIGGLALGWHFIGLATAAGMIGGLVLFLGLSTFCRTGSHPDASAETVLVVALFAGLLGHFVEVQFGFAVTPSSAYFWSFVALLVIVGRRRFAPGQPVDAGESYESPGPSTWPSPSSALLIGLIIAALAFAFVNPTLRTWEPGDGVRLIDVAATALTTKVTTDGPALSPALLWLFLGTLGLGLLLLDERAREVRRNSGEERLFGLILFAAICLTIFFAIVFAQAQFSTIDEAVALGTRMRIFPLFIALALTIIFLSALAQLGIGSPTRRWVRRWWSIPVATGMAVIVATSTASMSIGSVQTDLIHVQLTRFPPASAADARVELFERRLSRQPVQDFPFVMLANVYRLIARDATEVDGRVEALGQAEQALLQAREVNPYGPELTFQLAELHSMAAGLDADPDVKSRHFERAFGYYDDALRLSPHTAHYYERHAHALIGYAEFLGTQGDGEGSARARRDALAQLERASALDSRSADRQER